MSELFREDTDYDHLNTREGLYEELTTTFEAPPELTIDEYRALTPAKRKQFNLRRAQYTTGGFMVNNPMSLGTLTLHRQILRANLYAPNRTGLMLDGRGHMGKTALALYLMQWTFNKYVQDFPDWERDNRVPIVYVEAMPRSTGKSLLTQFADFFGLTVPSKYTTDKLLSIVIKAMRAAGTQMVVIDEFHNIAAKNAGNGDSVDYIKELHNAIRATFVIAGIQVRESDILAGARGDQLASRFIRQELARNPLATKEQKLQWQQLLLGFERELPLFSQQPKSILAHADELHAATNGSLGALAKLLFRTTIDLIWDAEPEDERFTAGMFLAQRRDITSESVQQTRAA